MDIGTILVVTVGLLLLLAMTWGLGRAMIGEVVDRDVDALRRDGVPLPDAHASTVRAWARRRAMGGNLGATLGSVGSLFALVSAEPWRVPLVLLGVVGLPLGQALGRAVASLREPRVWSDRRAADLAPRRVEDYVHPLSVAVARWSPGLLLVAGALSVHRMSGGQPNGVAGGATLAAVALGAVVWGGLQVLLRRVVAAAAPASDTIAVGWREILRAQLLVDLVSAQGMTGVVVGAGAVLWGVVDGWTSYPDWYLALAVMILALAAAVVVAMLAVEVQDRHRRWFRTHAGRELLA